MRIASRRAFPVIAFTVGSCLCVFGGAGAGPQDAPEKEKSDPAKVVYTWKGDGQVVDLQWTHQGARLALLIRRGEAKPGRLVVIDPAVKRVTADMPLPAGMLPVCGDWQKGDAALLVAFRKEWDEYPLYRVSPRERSCRKVYPDIVTPYIQIFEIVCDGGSARWAVACVGEGHPDAAIFDDGKLLHQTDVYPGGIGLVHWRDGKLLCQSTAWLEYGLTRDLRAKDSRLDPKKADGHDDWVVYRVDPGTGTAEVVENYKPDDAVMLSSDGQFRYEAEQDGETGFTVKFFAVR